MKTKLLLLFVTILTMQNLKAQNLAGEEFVRFERYVEVIGEPFAILKSTDLSKKAERLVPGIYRVNFINDTIVEVIAYFNPPTKRQREKNPEKVFYSDSFNDKIYTISRQSFNENAKIIEEVDILSIGILSLPFKARPQNDMSFDTEFNFNATLNIRLGSIWIIF